MTITATQQSQLLQMAQAMFGAAPGAIYLPPFENALASGASIANLATNLSGCIAFFGHQYPASLSSAQFADTFVTDLLGDRVSPANKAWLSTEIVSKMAAGATVEDIVALATQTLVAVPSANPEWGAAASAYRSSIAMKLVDNLVGNTVAADIKAAVVDYISSQLAAGQSFGQMVELAMSALDNTDHADAIWGNAAALFDHRIEVAAYYSVTKSGTATDLGTLQQTLAGVTADPASVASAESVFDTPLNGKVSGYLAGATVFVDLNGDGMHNPGEASVTTNANGGFTLPAGAFGKMLVSGGTDSATNLVFPGLLSAPAGSSEISPLTTVLQAMVESGLTVAQAQTQLLLALGLPGAIKLQSSDATAIALGNGTPEIKALAVHVQAAAAELAGILVQGAAIIQGVSSTTSATEAMSKIAMALAQQFSAASAPLDLTQAAILKNVMIDAAAATSPDASMAVQASLDNIGYLMASSVARIVAAEAAHPGDSVAALSQFAIIETVVQGAMADSLRAGMAAGSITNTVNDFTGTAFDTALAEVVGGNLTADIAVSTPPVFAGAAVNGSTLVMIYTEGTMLDALHAPAPGAFAVLVGGVANPVNVVVVDAAAKMVILTLSNPVSNGAQVTVAYTDPSAANDSNAIQDAAGNDAMSIAAQAVTNNTGVPLNLVLTTDAPIISELMQPGATTKAMSFTLTLASVPTQEVTVDYATQVSGSAASGADFVPATGTVTFAPGQTLAKVSIMVNDDVAPEGNETLKVLFSGASLAAPVMGTGRILANDTTGITVALTAAPDSTASLGLAGSDDIISGTIDQNTPAGGTLQAVDIFNGGLGTDTLTITPLTTVALTLDDLLFAGISGMDRMVINSTTTGAQTLITGDNFNTAFDAAGLDLQTTSTTGAMTINTSAFTGPTTLTVITSDSVGGNFITTGTGIATVTATSGTGPLTIDSSAAVFSTVKAISTTGFVNVMTGVGADMVSVTTGDALGGNVISTGPGKDVIDVSATTVTTAGNTIIGGLGGDTLILAGNTSSDTIVTGNTDSGMTANSVDSISGFATGIDHLKMGTVADATPASGNYVEAVAAVADAAAAILAANIALATLADTSPATELYAFQWDGANGYLFNDTDGDGTANQALVLVGIIGTMIASADIIA